MRFCPLYSGSSGNASLVWDDKTRVLVDAGLSAKTIVNALSVLDMTPDALDGVLVTHEHIDHVKGIGVLARKYSVPIYANEATWRAMPESIGKVPDECVRIITSDTDFYINDMNILPFRTPHDAAESVGYTFYSKCAQMSTVTDIGHVDARLINALCGSSLVLIESNHDVEMLKAGGYPYPLKRRILGENGHLSNGDCGIALTKLFRNGLKTEVLGHLSLDNNLEPLAYETVRGILNSDGIYENMLDVSIAHRDRIGAIYEISEGK